MLRIITLNLNGIRSAWRKGLLPWLAAQNADIICVQEIKAHYVDLGEEMKTPAGLHTYYCCAEKKGYSGVGLWSRRKPDRVLDLLGSAEFDREGRYLCADFGHLSVVSLYQPLRFEFRATAGSEIPIHGLHLPASRRTRCEWA